MKAYKFDQFCEVGRLSSEIQASIITSALDHIDAQSVPPQTTVWFTSPLTVDETIHLQNLINKHIKTINEIVNVDVQEKDTDGAHIVRIKAAKKGWSFWAMPIEITTSTINGNLYFKDANGNDYNWATCKIYNNSDDEIITAGLANANLLTCVKTILDIEPPFDFEMIGGVLRINSNPSQDVRMWIVGAPDIPAVYGGSKEFASGVNLKFLAPDSDFSMDGRVTKYIAYDPNTHSGKIRILLKHPAGATVNMQFIVHIYRL